MTNKELILQLQKRIEDLEREIEQLKIKDCVSSFTFVSDYPGASTPWHWGTFGTTSGMWILE